MTLSGDDRVVDMVVLRPNVSLLTVCEEGYGKRTDIDAYRVTRRGGKGIINVRVTDRNGRVVALKAVEDDDELMIITANGIMLRTDLSAVREIGRATQGVKVIRVDEGDRVAAVTRIARDEEETSGESQAEPEAAEQGGGPETNAEQPPQDPMSGDPSEPAAEAPGDTDQASDDAPQPPNENDP